MLQCQTRCYYSNVNSSRGSQTTTRVPSSNGFKWVLKPWALEFEANPRVATYYTLRQAQRRGQQASEDGMRLRPGTANAASAAPFWRGLDGDHNHLGMGPFTL